MAASSHKLVELLAARLASVAPSSVAIVADDELVSVYTTGVSLTLLGSSTGANVLDDDDDSHIEENVESAVLGIMNTVQDYISEALCEPWPRSGEGEMAMPNIRRDGRLVHMWFGSSERHPVIELAPIDITDVDGND